MHDVNRRLGVDLLAGDADTLWLDARRHELRCDWSEARRSPARRCAAASSRPRRPRRLLRRDAHRVLDGFVLEADTFADWLEASRREQAALVAQALEWLARAGWRRGRLAACAGGAERLVRIDPLAEAGYAGLMAVAGPPRRRGRHRRGLLRLRRAPSPRARVQPSACLRAHPRRGDRAVRPCRRTARRCCSACWRDPRRLSPSSRLRERAG
jgi:DNA-binding SARP family transcriptional activator